MPFTYPLETPDGESLGTIALGRPDNPPGSTLWPCDEPNLRVIEERPQTPTAGCRC
jgi:hypothetical protein